MSEKSNREVVERYVQAIIDQDLEAQDRLRHPDFVAEWPQSGERVRGRANLRAIVEHYPGGLQAGQVDVKAIHGSEDRWIATPAPISPFSKLRSKTSRTFANVSSQVPCTGALISVPPGRAAVTAGAYARGGLHVAGALLSERKTGLEPATPTLARLCSTN